MKVFITGGNYMGVLPQSARDILGFRSHVIQGTMNVWAKNKAEAIELLAAVGERATPRELRLAMGIQVDAINASGLIDDDTRVLCYAGTGGRETGIARLLPTGDPRRPLVEVVGHFRGFGNTLSVEIAR